MAREYISHQTVPGLKFNLHTKYGDFACLLTGNACVYIQTWDTVLNQADWHEFIRLTTTPQGDRGPILALEKVEIRGIVVSGSGHFFRTTDGWGRSSDCRPSFYRARQFVHNDLPTASFNTLVTEIERALNQHEANHPEMMEAVAQAHAIAIHNDLYRAEAEVRDAQKTLDAAKAKVAGLERELAATGIKVKAPD